MAGEDSAYKVEPHHKTVPEDRRIKQALLYGSDRVKEQESAAEAYQIQRKTLRKGAICLVYEIKLQT